MSSPSLPEAAAVYPFPKAGALKEARGGLSCIRYREVLLLQGTPVIGALYAVSRWSSSCVVPAALFGVASAALVAHIWSFNDWADFRADRRDPQKAAMATLRRGMEPPAILKVSLILLLVSLGLFTLLPWTTLALALSISLLGFLYSFPPIGWKGVPILSSVTHFVGGLLHFLLGYSLFSAIDRNAILIAPFFGLVFMAGHAIQEVQDYDADRIGGIRTNAVVFGKTAGFRAGLAGFATAYGYLLILASTGVVSITLGWLALGLFPLHLFWSLQALRGGLTGEGIRRLRLRYRVLFALLGAAMIVQRIL